MSSSKKGYPIQAINVVVYDPDFRQDEDDFQRSLEEYKNIKNRLDPNPVDRDRRRRSDRSSRRESNRSTARFTRLNHIKIPI